MNNIQPIIKTTTKIPFFRRTVLQNFPFIEKDFDALTDYELLCKVVEYLNKVIEQTNLMEDNENELVRVYNELYNYVENYFDNLDVQDEINNKLDEMVSDGTLQEIITQYLNSSAIWGFDTVSDMKNASNLINGSYARTLGYYDINDGGSALYKIRNKKITDIEDNGSIHFIQNNLIAELIITNNEVNIKQFGAKINNQNDDLQSFINCLLFAKTNNIFKIIIPETGSTLLISDTLEITQSNLYLDIRSNIKLTKTVNLSQTDNLCAINIHGTSENYLENIIVDGNIISKIDGNASNVTQNLSTGSGLFGANTLTTSYITGLEIRNIELTNGYKDCFANGNSHRVFIHNCIFSNSYRDNGCTISHANTIENDDFVIVKNCISKNCRDFGFTSWLGINVKFENCEAINCGNTGATIYDNTYVSEGGGFSSETPSATLLEQPSNARTEFINCKALNCYNHGWYSNLKNTILENCNVNTVYSTGTIGSRRGCAVYSEENIGSLVIKNCNFRLTEDGGCYYHIYYQGNPANNMEDITRYANLQLENCYFSGKVSTSFLLCYDADNIFVKDCNYLDAITDNYGLRIFGASSSNKIANMILDNIKINYNIYVENVIYQVFRSILQKYTQTNEYPYAIKTLKGTNAYFNDIFSIVYGSIVDYVIRCGGQYDNEKVTNIYEGIIKTNLANTIDSTLHS